MGGSLLVSVGCNKIRTQSAPGGGSGNYISMLAEMVTGSAGL
jgi:hypothetical protein